jgi:hypothetical protein
VAIAPGTLVRGRGISARRAEPSSRERCHEVAEKWLNEARPSIAVAGLAVELLRGLGRAARMREYYGTNELREPKKAL